MPKLPIEEVIKKALVDLNPFRSSHNLVSAIRETELRLGTRISEDSIKERCLLSEASTILSGFANTYKAREHARLKAIEYVRKIHPSSPAYPKLAIQFAEASVNWCYDTICKPSLKHIQSNLAEAWRECRLAMTSKGSEAFHESLMAQQASVHRAQAACSGHILARGFVQDALDVSRKNYKLHPDTALTNLDLGLSLTAAARWPKSESHYYELSQEAEKCMRTAHKMGSTLASLCLSRFLRQSYRPLEAILVFNQFAQREHRPRKVFEELHIASEAAVLLLHNNNTQPEIRTMLTWVSELLHTAFDAGYTSARLLVASSRLQHYLGNTKASSYFLKEIMPGGKLSWREALEKAREAIEDNNTDYLRSAFALGLIDGHVWNSLGTYVREVEGDNELALTLYYAAAQLTQKSPVIHTNIARLLLERGAEEDFGEIKKQLDLARRYADHSFRWWRPLLNTLNERETGLASTLAAYPSKHSKETYNLLYREFLKLEEQDSDPQARGQEFQDLFVRMSAPK